ncbi:uncharacterized protein LOC132708126 [Cylas formicarius]|uniref:uncharacterized protein LOC132708126 n=1 Tax=Cylas formicarius TaxID=197179 RepID=UPI002958DEFA|nr:uncharacterized protein LOC132708126 [Cylas formicarius]XP_060536237.1 uncharacterized protein LOC132708126 [Cylas formicarius]
MDEISTHFSGLDKMEKLMDETDVLAEHTHISRNGLSYQRRQRLKAYMSHNELQQICYLVDSHASTLRDKAAIRYQRTLIKDEHPEPARLKFLKNVIVTKCPPTEIVDCVGDMLRQVQELPKEWTIVQLTSSNITAAEVNNNDPSKYVMNPLCISVFNCGQTTVDPFLITVPEPRDPVRGNIVNLVEQLMSIVEENRKILTSTMGLNRFSTYEKKIAYYQQRKSIENDLKMLIKDMEILWLQHWRCLLIGKSVDMMVDINLKQEIDEFLNKKMNQVQWSSKSKAIFYYATKASPHLTLLDLKNIVDYCCESAVDKHSTQELIRFFKHLGNKYHLADTTNIQHPVILVVDEILDIFPWEMMDVIQDNPVCRMPSLHFIYFIYKTYESEIEDGHKIVTQYKRGTFVVNPDRDLEKMEIRIMNFYKYWVPDWRGTSDRRPTGDEFLELIMNTDIFAYNGHGNGSHIMSTEKVQRMFVNAVVLLFGCGSSQISRLGPQTEPYGSYHMYLIARCPCVVGMLWEVTDLDTDVLTAEFVSRWIPSTAPVHWKYVTNKNEWKKAQKNVDFHNETKVNGEGLHNPELLRALCQSKKCSDYFITRAACVVRGIPMKIKQVANSSQE